MWFVVQRIVGSHFTLLFRRDHVEVLGVDCWPKPLLRVSTIGFDSERFPFESLESMMWVRGIIGVVLCLTGVVWVLQGVNVIHGSFMSGNGSYTLVGAIIFALGTGLLAWAWRTRGRISK
jgi:hypothetical protein